MSKMKIRKALVVLGMALSVPQIAAAQDAPQAMPDPGLGASLMNLDGSAENATEAPTGWHTCDVVKTGAGWGNHYVALTCPAGPFTNRWHVMIANQKEAMLATALAAATSGKRVQVYIANGSPYNEIRALYWHN